MKKLSTLVAGILIILANLLPAAEAGAGQAPDVRGQLEAIMQEAYGLYESGKTGANAYAGPLGQLDELYATLDHADAEALAMVAGAKASIQQHVLGDLAAAKAVYEQLARDTAGSETAAKAEARIARIVTQMALMPGAEFPGFEFNDLQGNAVTLAGYRGKVVLIDFWATWCGPCVAELPNVLAAYKEFHDKGFEIIGISLDKDQARLDAFIAGNGMDWVQYFDGKGWDNVLSNKYGVSSIPATFLLDKNGVIVARDLRGGDLAKAVAKALE
jgi:peroxiredoxin